MEILPHRTEQHVLATNKKSTKLRKCMKVRVEQHRCDNKRKQFETSKNLKNLAKKRLTTHFTKKCVEDRF